MPSFASLDIPSLDIQKLVRTLAGAFGGRSTQASEGSLSVTDSRTGKTYIIPIERNAIRAIAFKEIQGNRVGSVADYVDGGLKVLDPGYQNTAVKESSITLINGQKGSIHFRGQSLDELVENHDWEEVVYLINWGRLPSMKEKLQFRQELAASMVVPQAVIDVIRAMPRDAHVSSMILAGLAAFASCDEGSCRVHAGSGKPYYLGNMKNVDAAIPRTLSALAVTIALTHCHKKGIEHTPVDPNGSFIGNLLLMMGYAKDGKPDAKIERCFEKLWILYADHEMTNSTSTFLHTSSSLTDPISSVGAAIVSAYGPLHVRNASIRTAYETYTNLVHPH